MFRSLCFVLVLFLAAACATGPSQSDKVVIWETKEIPRAHDVLGPVSVNVQVAEEPGEAIQGLAGFITQDGRMSAQIPPEMKAALDIKREKYKEMIFDKLGEKAKPYGADAVIGAEYLYVPPYVSFSQKATVSAKGTMVKYKK
jgi:uncharacterized protein YbjQ (UPF0145 family)